jgi:chemotaxis protein MotD
VTTPITAPMIPLGPELGPGKAAPTALDGFATLLGELATAVAAGAATATPGAVTVEGSPPEEPVAIPVVPDVLPEAAVVASSMVATPLPPPLSGQTGTSDPAQEHPALPTTASPVARAAVLRHGPPLARPDVPAQGETPAAFTAVAQRAALPVPAQRAPGLATRTAVGETVEPAAVPVPSLPAAAPAAPPAALPAVASEQSVERTEAVRPAILEAARGLRHEGNGRTSLVVRLNPPELGSVLVKLTVQDGRVDVQLRTPDLQAVGDLTAQSREVHQVLKDSGFDLSSFDVSHGGVPDDRGQGKTPDRGTTQRDRHADGRAEPLRVTDDVPEARSAGTWL